MDNVIKVFESNEFGAVRTAIINGEPWFVAADVCKALDIQNPTDAIKKLDDDEKARLNLGLRGGDTNVVNEPGLYSLVLGSRKPEAKAFKRWITHEVIPAIRKTGGYIANEENYTEDELVAKAFTVVMAKLEQREQRIAELTEQNKRMLPKAEFADAISGSSDCITVKQLAHLLTQNGYPIGRNRLFSKLREDDYLCFNGSRRNLPKQSCIERGLFAVKETSFGANKIGFVTLITSKGQKFFLRKYANKILSDEEIQSILEEAI